jgi:serine/threonine-protein kinase
MSGAYATASNGIVIGRYVLYDEIASGGMATIHIGRLVGEGGFSRPVAIKRLHPQFARDSEFVSMFLEEARLAARIRHANVVPVVDIVSTDAELFLVMEFIQGETITRLTRVSRSRARIVPMNVALAIAADMLQGLHAAHEARDERGEPLGIVHRDISPHNIMVGRDGVSRVLDFGIAKATSSAQSTRDGEVKGKFAYMSPEQLSSVRVDRRADVFAASIVLWEMLTGQRLFSASDPAAIVGKVLNGEIKPPSQCAPGLPASIDALVLKGLSRDRDQRFATAVDMARAIEKLGIAIARPTEVGTWVNRIAGDALKQRAKRLAEIESTGSFSRDGAANALAMLSQPRIDDTGSHSASQSRSGMRPVGSAPSFPNAMPSSSTSQPLPAIADASQALAPLAPSPPSHLARNLIVLVALACGALGAFVWRAGGVGPARDRVAQWRHTEPHGEEFRTMRTGTISASTATPSAVVTAPSASTIDMDIASVPTTTAAVNAPHVWSGGHVSRGHVAPTETANVEPTQNAIVAPTGPVSMRPGQGQVQAALVALLKSARACFNPGDPPSRATVTFQSDGSVKSVAVSGFGAGKPQAACVQGMFGKARVDPFSDPTYSLPVTIQP